MINKPTQDSRTIIDHLYVSQIVNTIQTGVTDCYYSDHDCILFLITVLLTYITFLLNTHIDILNIIWYILIWIKYSQKCANMSNKCQFGTMSHCQTDIHLMNISL